MKKREDEEEEVGDNSSGSESEEHPLTVSPSKTSSLSEEERLQLALRQIQHLENELTDFQQSSYELEQELEKELNDLETKNEELSASLEASEKDCESWKSKYIQLEKEFNKLNDKNEEKFKNYKKELNSVRGKLVNIEIMNDNIEQNERILSINLNDLESKYNDSLEKIALIESELDFKDELLLKEKLSNQNTQNKYNELKLEFDKLRAQNRKVSSSSTNTNESSMISYNNLSQSDSLRRIPKSNSMKQLHNMIEQTKFMENRVESIRNTIRPSKMRKVSGRTNSIHAQPVENQSFSNENSRMSSSNSQSLDLNNTSYFSTLTKSNTNDSLSHSKAKRQNIQKRPNLQKPPIQPLTNTNSPSMDSIASTLEFSNHFKEKISTTNIDNESTIKMVSNTHFQNVNKTPTIKKVRSQQLETIKGSPNNTKLRNMRRVSGTSASNSPKTPETKKLFNPPKGTKTRKKGGLLPSLRKFNLS